MAAKQQAVKQKTTQGNTAHKFTFLSEANYPWLVLAFGILLYFNTIPNDYNLDDELVTQNHRLTSKGISAIPEIFTSPYYEDQAGYKYEYRPIVLTTFAIEHSLFGESPHVSHFINMLLYGLMCMLLFFVLRNILTGYSLFFVWLVVLFFTAHPIHSEVVASIKNRDELLALSFSLLALHFSVRYVQSAKWWYVVLVPLFFYIGILSKSTAIVFAALVPVILITLTEVKFMQLLLTTALLALPMLAYARLYSLTQQILVCIGLFVAVTFLYALKKSETVWKEIKMLAEKIKNSLSSYAGEKVEEESELWFGFLRNPVANLPFFIAVVILTVATAWGISVGNSLWISIPFTLLCVLFYAVRQELKVLLITPIVLLLSYNVMLNPLSVTFMEVPLVVFLISMGLSNHRTSRFIVVFNYFVFALVSAVFGQSYFFVVGLVFIGLFNKKLLPVSYIVALILGVYGAKGLYELVSGSNSFSVSVVRVPLLLFAFVVLWSFNKKLSDVIRIALVPLMLGFFLFLFPPNETFNFGSAVQRTYYNLNVTEAADLTPVQSVRPLKYIEYPLEKTDPISVKVGTSMTVLAQYLRLILLPYPMSFYYGYAYITPTNVFNAVPIIVVAIHLLLISLSLWLIKKHPLVSASIIIYTIAILVFSGLFIPVPGMMGDRFLLIPSIGFSLLLGWILFRIFKMNSADTKLNVALLPSGFKTALIIILVAYSGTTIARNFDWKNRVTLFSKDIKAVSESAQAQNLLGLHLFLASANETDKTKQLEMRTKAVTHFREAIRIYPPFLNATFDLGRVLETIGKPDEAYEAYEKTVAIDTSFYAPYFSMAIIQNNKGNMEKAIELYEKYLIKYPRHKEVYANLSFAYFKTRQFDKSIQTNQRLLAMKQDLYEPTINIAKTYLEMGQKDSAYHYFQLSYRLNPNEKNIPIILQQLEKELKK
ncbi:MAG: tetratricopeptide repeat protein [Chitinophagales bacterium]|nr:tetratricopeptide repeat protein [Chitinophagales bacterium]